jgi:hypothetical protein
MAINAFFFPLRADSFQNFTASRVFRDRDAAHAASQSAVLMWGFPWTVRVLFLPALSWLPGETPAQEDKWAAEGNGSISVPISAIIEAAVIQLTPGMVWMISISSW